MKLRKQEAQAQPKTQAQGECQEDRNATKPGQGRLMHMTRIDWDSNPSSAHSKIPDFPGRNEGNDQRDGENSQEQERQNPLTLLPLEIRHLRPTHVGFPDFLLCWCLDFEIIFPPMRSGNF
jgi:hypothetical protein